LPCCSPAPALLAKPKRRIMALGKPIKWGMALTKTPSLLAD